MSDASAMSRHTGNFFHDVGIPDIKVLLKKINSMRTVNQDEMLDYLEGVSDAFDEIYQQRCEALYVQRQYELENFDFNPGNCYPD